ncbi:PIN domain nuclease [Agrobacterium pusense]|jgi:predicted nucleic acid-binding protein|uniref:type II toxin-antitoxin system VapC family toxin n=1 Tax=Agrobacterium pusense TaxID=648995 RepID=UPI001C6E6033|nr:PIN domain nuclease [Agrobacterium pusense]MBW9067834.1 PIN domain nuclease [Agrobacterium pusense]MBW9082220.1 PIN domain nuclease [Agrobacterium pusense]MBW9126614.1 PIN domain nuclease [Agrobacterium pusense]MBW9139199.1 PIN domain nuclease [Agrobacterium pusense]
MIVVDTSVWIDWFHNKSTRQGRMLNDIGDLTDVIIGDIILLEILQGERNDDRAAAIHDRLKRFGFVSMLTPELAVKSAANYRKLRSVGKTVRKTPDLIIGTYCIEHGHKLLQNDRDFQPMADHLGLQLA